MQNECWVCRSEVLAEDNFCRNCGVELIRQGSTGPARSRIDRRVPIGIFLITLGAIVGLVSYFMGIISMLAFALASFVIGIMVLYLPESAGNMANRLATDSSLPSLLVVENLLLDLDLDERGIYIPASGLGNCPKVFVPLSRTMTTRRPPVGLNNSRRIFVTVGQNPEDRGILLESPGGQILMALEQTLNNDLANTGFDELERNLNSALRSIGIAKITSLERDRDEVTVEIELTGLIDLETRLRNVAPRVVAQIGTPVTSVVAAAVCKAAKEYVMLKSAVFDASNKKMKISLKLSE